MSSCNDRRCNSRHIRNTLVEELHRAGAARLQIRARPGLLSRLRADTHKAECAGGKLAVEYNFHGDVYCFAPVGGPREGLIGTFQAEDGGASPRCKTLETASTHLMHSSLKLG